MDRRRFLGFFSAAAAALTVAKTAVGSAPAKAAAPAVIRAPKVSVNTSGYQRSLAESERMVRDLVSRCHVVSCEAILSATQPQQLRVIYSDWATPSGMDVEVAKVTKSARIRECSVSSTIDGRNEIEVTWLLVP